MADDANGDNSGFQLRFTESYSKSAFMNSSGDTLFEIDAVKIESDEFPQTGGRGDKELLLGRRQGTVEEGVSDVLEF